VDTVTIEGRSQPFPSHAHYGPGQSSNNVPGCDTHSSLFTATSRPCMRRNLSLLSGHLWLFFEWRNDQITKVTFYLKCVVSRIFVGQQTHARNTLCTQYYYLSMWVKNCLDCHITSELFRTTPKMGQPPATFQASTAIILSNNKILSFLLLITVA
jgi:hypothetical protein